MTIEQKNAIPKAVRIVPPRKQQFHSAQGAPYSG
jgi:hypothetical protein